MDGLLIIDKPAGITSHDVVLRVRRILRTKRVGHSGTLDPFATGVMVLLIGRATRLAQFVDKDEKEYEAVIRFGFETDTGDLTGAAIAGSEGQRTFSISQIETALEGFRGEIMQTPPMFSAKKIAGKKLYEHARKGETVDREPIAVTISILEQLDRPDDGHARIRVVCSAGTYIRTLAQDIGRALLTGAHLVELRRVRAGAFSIEQSLTLDELAELNDASERLLPVETAVSSLATLRLTSDRVEKTRNGLSTRIRDGIFADGENVRMTSEAGELIAIGKYSAEESSLRPFVVLV